MIICVSAAKKIFPEAVSVWMSSVYLLWVRKVTQTYSTDSKFYTLWPLMSTRACRLSHFHIYWLAEVNEVKQLVKGQTNMPIQSRANFCYLWAILHCISAFLLEGSSYTYSSMQLDLCNPTFSIYSGTVHTITWWTREPIMWLMPQSN